ncbi:MAG: hypothetical protein ACJ768_06290 [Gaiellaceae bacterium]
MKRIAVILAVSVCALALPAGALAQSAGDNQYTDPLASPHSGSTSTNQGSSGSSTPAPSQGSSSGSSGTAGTSSSGAAPGTGATASGRALPRTGGHPELIAVAGLVLLAGGLGLRRAGRRSDEPPDFESVFLRFG